MSARVEEKINFHPYLCLGNLQGLFISLESWLLKMLHSRFLLIFIASACIKCPKFLLDMILWTILYLLFPGPGPEKHSYPPLIVSYGVAGLSGWRIPWIGRTVQPL